MKKTWLLVADRGRANLFSVPENPNGTLETIGSFTHEEGTMHRHDTVSDRQGYFAGGNEGSLEAGEPATDYKHKTAENFATELHQYLDKERHLGKFERLAVIAPPLFLGVLRNKYSSALSQIVSCEIDKELTQEKPENIIRHLPKEIWND